MSTATKSNNPIPFALIEDNGGNVWLCVKGATDDECAYVFDMSAACDITADLAALRDGTTNPAHWDNAEEAPQAHYDELMNAVAARNGGAKIIATEKWTLGYDDVGAAGRIALNLIEDEA